MASSAKVVAARSERGNRGIELFGPLSTFEAVGDAFGSVAPRGKRSPVLPQSIDTNYLDLPLGVYVTTPEGGALVKAHRATSRVNSTRGDRGRHEGSGQ